MGVSRMRDGVNRALLALAGLAALCSGLWLTAASPLVRDGLPARLPSWWHLPGPGARLADSVAAPVSGLSDAAWWTPAVIATLAVLLLALLWWLAAQSGPRRPGALDLAGPGQRLSSRALSQVLTTEVAAVPEVARARVRLSGRRLGRLRARLTVVLEPDAEPGPVLERVAGGPLVHARDSAGLEELPCVIRMRVASHRTHRAY